MTPADLGRLGEQVQRLFGWPPVGPEQVRSLLVTSGDGVAAGRAEADALVDGGVELVVLDATRPLEPGLAVIATLLDLEPVRVVGTEAAPGWAAQVVAVRERTRRLRPLAGDPLELVADDPVLGRLTGVLQRCSERRTPVLLGGEVAVLAAALAVARTSAAAPTWWLVGSSPPHQAGRAVLDALRLEPLLDLGVRIGGAQLALRLLLDAAAMVRAGETDRAGPGG